MATPPTVTTSFTNTKGQKVTKYSDGTKTYSGGTPANTTPTVNAKATPPTPNSLMTQLQRAQTALNQKTGKTTPTITSSTLTPTAPIKITPSAVPVETAGLQGTIQGTQDTYTQSLIDDRKAKESALAQPRNDIQDFLREMRGKTTLTDEQYSQKGGVDAVQKELNDINQQILVEQRSLQNKLDTLEKNSQGKLQGGLEDQMNDVTRESIKKQADLSIIQMGVQGRYDSAKSIADRAVSAYMEKQDLILKTAMFNYQENKDLFTASEQREFETLAGNRERELTTEKENKKSIYDLGIQAQLDGAPTSVVQSMFAAKTKEEAMSIGGSYIGRLDRQVKEAQLASANRANQASAKKDTQFDKDGNLVNMQTGEIISSAGGQNSQEGVQKSLDQISFLQTTINDAKGLVDASGPNMISQGFGNFFIGNTRAKQLANKLDTLKTNLLTLNSDPALKKFFGPQMTEKDTQLLMSAGSTLNAYSASEANNRAELTRYSELLNRMQTAIQNSGKTFGLTLTGADGLQYTITD